MNHEKKNTSLSTPPTSFVPTSFKNALRSQKRHSFFKLFRKKYRRNGHFYQSYRNEFLISYYDTLRLWHCCHRRKCWVVMSRSISLRVSDIFNSLQITKTIPEQAVSFGWNCCITSKALTNTCMSTNKHK